MSFIDKLKDKVPFLQNFDNKSIIFAGVVILLLLVMLIVNIASSGKKEEQAGPRDKSELLQKQMGEDRDVLDIEDNLSVREEVAKKDRQASFAEELFSESLLPTGENEKEPEREMTEEEKRRRADAFFGIDNVYNDNQPTETARKEKKEKPSSGRDEIVRNSRQYSTSSSSRRSDEERIAERRRRLIEMGYDPDTGMPLGQKTAPEAVTAPEAQPQPQAPADSVTDESPAPEIARAANIRRSGSVSSLDDDFGTVSGVSSLDSDNPYIRETENHPFSVMFSTSEKVSSGGRITLRLLEDMMLDGVRIPENSPLSAIVSVSGNRLKLKVAALKVNDKIYSLDMTAYDTDGIEGLYCAQSVTNRSLKRSGDEGISIARSLLGAGVAGTAGTIVNSGATIIQNSATGRTTISVTAGYKFYLMKKIKK